LHSDGQNPYNTLRQIQFVEHPEAVVRTETQFPLSAERGGLFQRFAVARLLYRRVTQLLIDSLLDEAIVPALSDVKVIQHFWRKDDGVSTLLRHRPEL